MGSNKKSLNLFRFFTLDFFEKFVQRVEAVAKVVNRFLGLFWRLIQALLPTTISILVLVALYPVVNLIIWLYDKTRWFLDHLPFPL